jgi:hypothetical protein
MSAVIRMTLLCDECYGHETEEMLTDSIAEARGVAERQGWIVVPEDRDVCPSCQEDN